MIIFSVAGGIDRTSGLAARINVQAQCYKGFGRLSSARSGVVRHSPALIIISDVSHLQVYPGGIVNTYRWKPLSVNETKIEVDWWLPHGQPNTVEREIILQHRTTTFAEDGPIVDSVQRGLESGALQHGALVVDDACSSQSEHPIMAFNAHYQKAMGNMTF